MENQTMNDLVLQALFFENMENESNLSLAALCLKAEFENDQMTSFSATNSEKFMMDMDYPP